MNSNINFNPSFGDITLIGNDIEILRGESKVTSQDIIQLFKTNKGDYELFSNYGLNSDSFVGRPVSELLAEEIKERIHSTLLLNEISGANNTEVLYIIEKNIIHLRVIIPGLDTISVNFLKEKGFEIE